MQINTKYEIGQHVWHIYENKGEVGVFDDFIGWITIEDGITYGLKESYADGVKEEDICLYEDTDTLLKRIVTIMEDIRNKEQLDK